MGLTSAVLFRLLGPYALVNAQVGAAVADVVGRRGPLRGTALGVTRVGAGLEVAAEHGDLIAIEDVAAGDQSALAGAAVGITACRP